MVYRILLLGILITSQSALAALAPKYQNAKDFDVIIAFIKTHDRVMETLVSIDFRKYVIHFDDNCEVIFTRKEVDRPQGWTGPAEPLEYLSSSCPIQ